MDSDTNSDGINTSLTTLSINETSPVSQDTVSSQDVRISDNSSPILSQKSEETAKKISIARPPPFNVPEKVIFCLDTFCDSNSPAFKISTGSSYTSLYMLKRVIEIYVLNKSYIDSRHEFALLTYNKTNVNWVQEFTNKPIELIRSLNNVLETDQEGNEFDLSVLLEQVWQMIQVPKQEKDINIPPPFVVHLIILYSRNCVPVLEKNFKELLTNPYFVVDVILSHEETQEDNKQQEIFDSLCIDPKDYAYSFSVGRNPTILHDSMAKLLAHLLQRPLQSLATYQITNFEKEE